MELLVLVVIISILAALAVSAFASALSKAHMNGTMNNARQIYLAQFQMASDGTTTGDATSTWPGDLINGSYIMAEDLQGYARLVLAKGYVKGADWLKLLSAPGANFRGTVSGTPETITFTGGTAALKVYPVLESDPANAVFAASHNYVYDTALASAGVPYGAKGFIVIRKGGDGAVFKAGQATKAGWNNNGTVFQTQVGLATGQTPGNPQPGDPTGYLHYN